jgi:alpha-N-arabinofuranosidase
MQWDTDLIGYDAFSSHGSPSYWAQVLFGSYLGTEVVAATLANAGPRVYASATRDEKQLKLFVKVVNATSEGAALNITLNGVANVGREATLTP